MRQNQWTKTGKGSCRTGNGLLAGVLCALGGQAALLAITAVLISRGTLPLEGAALPAKGCYLLAVTVGCWATARRARGAKLLWAGLTGLGSFLAAAGAALAAGDGGQTNLLPLLLLTLLGILLGGLLGARRKRLGYE